MSDSKISICDFPALQRVRSMALLAREIADEKDEAYKLHRRTVIKNARDTIMYHIRCGMHDVINELEKVKDISHCTRDDDLFTFELCKVRSDKFNFTDYNSGYYIDGQENPNFSQLVESVIYDSDEKTVVDLFQEEFGYPLIVTENEPTGSANPFTYYTFSVSVHLD